MGISGKERQAKLRAERKAAGKRQVTVYVDDAQDLAIKNLLAGSAPAAQPPQAILDDLAAREQTLADQEAELARRAEKVAFLELYRKINITQGELSEEQRRLGDLQKQLDQRRAALEREEKALAKRADTEKMSFGDRRKRLIEVHTTTIDAKTGGEKLIDTAWSAAGSKKDMAELSRKTRVAANTIQVVMAQFGRHELLSEREKAALDLAKTVLGDLADAAGEAKETVAAHAKKIKEEEQARERASQIAARSFGDPLSASDLVAVVDWLRDSYDLRRLRRDVINEGDFYALRRIRESGTNSIAGKIATAMKVGKLHVTEATKQVRAEFDAAMPAAVEKHAELIRDLNTKLVQSQLEKANAKEQKRIK